MSTDPPVVGRDEELTRLARELTSAGGGCVAIAGEAGIGKSALARAAAGERAAVGTAIEPPAPPLRPLVEVALGAVRAGADPDADGLRVHRRALAALLPGLLPDQPGDGSTVHPVVLADTMRRLLDTLPATPRWPLVLEDLHWADADTLATVEALAERATDERHPLLLTLRPEGEPWRRVLRLAERRLVTVLELGPLGEDAVLALLARRLGTDPVGVPDELVAAVGAAEGRPLWVEEIVETALGDGSLRRDPDGWTLAEVAPIVPRSLGAGVRHRLDELGPDRIVVEHAAVLGQDVPVPLLARALGRDTADVAAALRAAAGAGLLALGRDGALRFRHELLRTAVLDALPATDRRAVAAALLAALGEPAPAALALAAALATQAGDGARAATLLLAAARVELDRGLPGTAARTLDRALAIAVPTAVSTTTVPAGVRREARELRVHARALAGDVDAALTDAAVLADELADIPGAENRARRLGEAVVRATAGQGRWADADRLVTDLRARFPRTASTSALAALVALERGRFADAEDAARSALALAGADATARCEALEVLGRLARRVDLAAAQRWFRLAVAAAEEGGLAVFRARALHELATVTQLRDIEVGPLLVARDAATDAAAPGVLTAVDLHLAAVHGVRFEPEAALPAARRTLDVSRRLGARRQEAFAWILVGQAHAAAGRRVQADIAAAEALGLDGTNPEIVGLAWAVCRGLPALLDDDLDTACAHWLRAIAAMRELPDVTPLPPWYLWGLLSTVVDLEGDGGARARAETDTPGLRVTTGANALWHLADAVARGRAGDDAGCAAAARTAEELFDRIPGFAGYRHLGYRLAAEPALRDGWGDPARWLPAAQAWATQRGLTGLARAARSLAGRAGIRSRRAGRGDSTVPAHLTALGVTSREMDVLTLVAQGLTNKEIAQRLYLAPRTVKGHVELLLAKTGTQNRTQLAQRLLTGDG